jgi:hypothetical protein
MIDFPDLDTRFTRLAVENAERRTAAYGAVVRWEWYDDEAFDLRQLWYEREIWRRGRLVEERPPLECDHYGVGFDAGDRLVVTLEYCGSLGGTLQYETFRVYQADGVEETHFYADGRPIYLHDYRFESGRINSAASVAVSGGGYETYDYDGDQVTRISVHHADRKSGDLIHLALRTIIDASYDRNGLSRLQITDTGFPPRVQYERPPEGFSTSAACQAVQAQLVVQVPRAVRELAIDSPTYCVALVYNNAHDPADVAVHVGLEEDRLAFLADDADPDVLWSPADMAHCTNVDMSAVADDARLLAQELTLASTTVSRDVACAVARTLSGQDWSALLPTTSDFVVFAIDIEMADLEHTLPGHENPLQD